jgi:hypothetical protein
VLTLRVDQQYQHNGSRRAFRSVHSRVRGTVAAPEGLCLLVTLVSNTSHRKEMTRERSLESHGIIGRVTSTL